MTQVKVLPLLSAQPSLGFVLQWVAASSLHSRALPNFHLFVALVTFAVVFLVWEKQALGLPSVLTAEITSPFYFLATSSTYHSQMYLYVL